ncbi:MAG TPA: hypothetical protein VJ124_16740 [Pyrinomonadaceae bacterium]|nr:hypothetical protein [Pyrinomonadaceae bacterium]
MTLLRIFCITVLAALLFVCPSGNGLALAQSREQATQAEQKDRDIDLDTQLYLLIATNQDVQEKLPPILEPLMKQLRTSLPFKNYRLATTLINRVKNGGRLNLKWIGGPFLTVGATTAGTPSFNEFRVNVVRLFRDTEGREIVSMEGFSFGARVPIQVGSAASAVASTAPPAPVINYEPTGLTTDISMREAEPVVVGTLNVGSSGEAIILVMSAKQAAH